MAKKRKDNSMLGDEDSYKEEYEKILEEDLIEEEEYDYKKRYAREKNVDKLGRVY